MQDKEKTKEQLLDEIKALKKETEELRKYRTDLSIEDEVLQKAYDKLKETRALLIQAEKMEAVGKVASSIAHEVKNPLGIVLQGVNYLEHKLSKQDKHIFETIQLMKNNIQRANRIISALMDFSRVSKLDLKLENIDDILESSLVLVQHIIKPGSIKISKKIQDNSPQVLVDKEKMEQVFVNIFRNAIEAMPKGGKLFINVYSAKLEGYVDEVAEIGDYFRPGETVLTIEVEDTGCGMSPQDLKKVFEPFFSVKGAKEGTGLGMSITKGIIDMHRGGVQIESQKGKGTKVIIRLKI